MIELFHNQMGNPSASKQAYNELYHDRGILQRDSFYLWILRLMNPQPEKLLLDISTGEGRLVALAQRAGQPAAGMDFSLQAVGMAVQNSGQPCFSVADGECLPVADASVDYITHIGSLEHYISPERGACEIGRILKPGGRAVILLPNAFGLFGNIKHVWLHGDVFDDGQPIQRYATRELWQSILEQGGLTVEKVVPYSEIDFPRTPADFLWLLARPQKIVRGLLSKMVPTTLANHLVFICTRGSEDQNVHIRQWTYHV
jgi:SAM-dependent methyltransferase